MAGSPHNFAPPADPAECRELVEQIASSSQFRRSPRQRELLRYLCRIALEEPGAELNEQRIRTELFGRAPDDDTGVDTIVRVHASDLRKRLKAHFDGDGAASPLVVDIPIGGYTPVFSRRKPVAPETTDPALVTRAPHSQRSVWIALAALVLAVGATWWARGAWDARTAQGDLLTQPALAALWSQFDRPEQPTHLVVADSTFGLLQDLRRASVPLSDYAGRDFWRSQETDDRLRILKNREYTGMADLAVVRRLTSGFGSHWGRIDLVMARHFQTRLLNTDNVILVGSKRSNPWAELCEPQQNFTFETDEQTGRAKVRNRAPQKGEQALYEASISSDPDKRGYAVVAFLPNLRRTGSVLLLAGTSTAETEIAVFYVTTSSILEQLSGQLAKGPGGRLPYFELLIKTQRVGQDAPRHQLIATRVYS